MMFAVKAPVTTTVKTIGSNGQISLGKKVAGRQADPNRNGGPGQ
jgi:hypothetical protein